MRIENIPPPRCPRCDEPYIEFEGGPYRKNRYYKVQNKTCGHSDQIRTTINIEDYERLVRVAFSNIPSSYLKRVTRIFERLSRDAELTLERYERETRRILQLYRRAYGESVFIKNLEIQYVIDRLRSLQGLVRAIFLHRARIEICLIGGGRVVCEIKGITNITRTFDPEWVWVAPARRFVRSLPVKLIQAT